MANDASELYGDDMPGENQDGQSERSLPKGVSRETHYYSRQSQRWILKSTHKALLRIKFQGQSLLLPAFIPIDSKVGGKAVRDLNATLIAWSDKHGDKPLPAQFIELSIQPMVAKEGEADLAAFLEE